MENKLKVYLVDNQKSYLNWLPNAVQVHILEDADLVLFEGGEDVHPFVYGDYVGSHTNYNTKRDSREIRIFDQALGLNKPMLGICRGSQFLCAMAGGKLVQHQENRAYVHDIVVDGDKTIPITSTHHQAAYPFKMPKSDYTILGYTKDMSKYHLNGSDTELYPPVECEIVYYPKINALGIQGHPEYIWNEKDKYSATFEYLLELFNKFINKKL